MLASLESYPDTLELTEVPFHAQVTDQCGPAALASVLNDAGVAVTPLTLKSQIYIPDRKGSLQFEMIAAARQAGRIAYTLDPDLTAILAELEHGRPVLILQNLGVSLLPVWHYAVVVGYQPHTEQLVLRSGDRPRHLLSARKFIKSWQRADFWGFVVLQPGELPAVADPARYLRAVADLEETGQLESAQVSYIAATKHWPDNTIAWLGRGNTEYQSGRPAAAVYAYEQTLRIEPNHAVASNNLAHVLAATGQHDKALKIVKSALANVSVGDPEKTYLRQTLREIQLAQNSPD